MSDDLSPIMTFQSSIADAEAVPPIHVGVYPAVISAVEVKKSKKSENRYAAITLNISPDDYPADYANIGPSEGVVVSYNRLMVEDNPQARYRIKKFFISLGEDPPGREVNFMDLVGKPCRVKLKHSTFDGEVRAEVEAIMAPA